MFKEWNTFKDWLPTAGESLRSIYFTVVWKQTTPVNKSSSRDIARVEDFTRWYEFKGSLHQFDTLSVFTGLTAYVEKVVWSAAGWNCMYTPVMQLSG